LRKHALIAVLSTERSSAGSPISSLYVHHFLLTGLLCCMSICRFHLCVFSSAAI
jgi:hypothetical protein